MPYANSYGGGGEDFNCRKEEGTSGARRVGAAEGCDLLILLLMMGKTEHPANLEKIAACGSSYRIRVSCGSCGGRGSATLALL
jgi:hypothetical protein